jgi:hypothetical protein
LIASSSKGLNIFWADLTKYSEGEVYLRYGSVQYMCYALKIFVQSPLIVKMKNENIITISVKHVPSEAEISSIIIRFTYCSSIINFDWAFMRTNTIVYIHVFVSRYL